MAAYTVKFGIGRRIAALVSAVVAVTVLCVAGLLAAHGAVQATIMKRSAVEGTAYVFASAVADHVEHKHSHEIQAVLRSVSRVPGVISASVHGESGQIIGSLGKGAILQSHAVSGDPGFWEMLRSRTMAVKVNIVKSGRTVGTLALVTDISDLRDRFFNTLAATLIASLFAAALGVVLSVPLQRRITQPIARLTEAMQRIKQSRDYSATIEGTDADETGVMVESFNSLVSDIRQRDESLQQLAYFDPLTGLPNRSNFVRILAEVLDNHGDNSGTVAVILLNIDSFHSLNDAFGHDIGDAILKSVAATLRKEANSADTICRTGGDEFALMITDNSDGSTSEATLARIHAAFFNPIKVSDLEIHLTLSAGVTTLPHDGTDAGDALRHADLAVKAAKLEGQGRTVHFRASMDEAVRSSAEMSQGLRSAISRGELFVHYQPQLHASSSRIVGFEALLRWKHPTFGYVSPATFIPLAEKSGSIIAIGDWILEEGCRQAKAWIDAGEVPRTVSVNVSPAQLLQSDYVRKVAAILARVGLPPHLLCLEVTESLFLGRSLASIKLILDELHGLGITLALDDFGTGYSSLAYLSQLPFEKLKTDRSFISSANNSPRRLEILRSIIAMAHALGLEVVAEGAETDEEIALLRHMHADEIQGYGIAMPAEANIALLCARRFETAGSAAKDRAG